VGGTGWVVPSQRGAGTQHHDGDLTECLRPDDVAAFRWAAAVGGGL